MRSIRTTVWGLLNLIALVGGLEYFVVHAIPETLNALSQSQFPNLVTILLALAMTMVIIIFSGLAVIRLISVGLFRAIVPLSIRVLIRRGQLRPPGWTEDFEAEILDQREEYHAGEFVRFRTFYRGVLTNGSFSNHIVSPDRKLDIWDSAPKTVKDDKGTLNGFVNNHEELFGWLVPKGAPKGQYEVTMGVYEHVSIGNPDPRQEKRTTFSVN